MVTLSTNSRIWTEISSMQNRGKPITFDEICKLNGNFSTKLHLYSDGIPGKPPRVSTVLQYPRRKFVDIETKPRGFKKNLKNRGKAPSFPRFWIFNKCLWENTYYILMTKKWIKYNTGKVIYRKEIYQESKIWEKTYWSKREKNKCEVQGRGQKVLIDSKK